MQPEVTDLTRYLEPSEVVDWRSPEIMGLDQEQLAFPVDPTRGEYTDQTIYAEPLPVVVNCLRRFTARSEMWPHLLESLDLPCPD